MMAMLGSFAKSILLMMFWCWWCALAGLRRRSAPMERHTDSRPSFPLTPPVIGWRAALTRTKSCYSSSVRYGSSLRITHGSASMVAENR